MKKFLHLLLALPMMPIDSNSIQPISIFQEKDEQLREELTLLSANTDSVGYFKKYKKKEFAKYHSYQFSLKGSEFYLVLGTDFYSKNNSNRYSINSLEYRHMKYQLNLNSTSFQIINNKYFNRLCLDFDKININAYQSLDGFRNYLVFQIPANPSNDLKCLILYYNSNHIQSYYL